MWPRRTRHGHRRFVCTVAVHGLQSARAAPATRSPSFVSRGSTEPKRELCRGSGNHRWPRSTDGPERGRCTVRPRTSHRRLWAARPTLHAEQAHLSAGRGHAYTVYRMITAAITNAQLRARFGSSASHSPCVVLQPAGHGQAAGRGRLLPSSCFLFGESRT
jgi:hypothetical protein